MTKSKSIVIILRHRGVAQLGSAFGSGPKGRKFKSCHLDQQAKLGLFRAKKNADYIGDFFTLFCLRFASVHRQDSPKCMTLASTRYSVATLLTNLVTAEKLCRLLSKTHCAFSYFMAGFSYFAKSHAS